MKTTIKNIAIATSLSSMLLISTVSYAEGINTTGGVEQVQEKQNRSDKRLAKLSKKLGLSESQQAAVKVVNEQTRTGLSAFKPAMKAYREQVKTLISAETFDEQAFITLRESHNETFTSMALIKAKSKSSMKKILTAEQLTKYMAMKQKHARKHKQK